MLTRLIYFPDYMEGNDCGDGKYIGGATVYSHLNPHGSSLYKNSIECRITFKAENDQWRLMMRFVELDIPDKTYNGLCSDAVYVYDANTIGGRAVVSDLFYYYACFICFRNVQLLHCPISKQQRL